MSRKIYALTTSPAARHPAQADSLTASVSRHVYVEGMAAGVVGALTIAIWFLILDALAGRPLYTPSLLEMTLMYTWVHVLVFCVIGGAAARLLALAEDHPDLGFGVLLLFVVLEFGFVGTMSLAAERVLNELTGPAVLGGNLLAATAMGAYFWRRHPNLRIRP